MAIKIRKSTPLDWEEVLKLYQAVSAIPGGLARDPSEISGEYVKEFLHKSSKNGLGLVATNGIQIVGEIHAYKLQPKVFSHVLSELTIAIHPDFQGMGVGRSVFTDFLSEIENHHTDILRVELISRESNQKAIRFYESIGFRKEGRFERRIDRGDGTFEADIPMAWLNPNFSKS